MRAQEKARPSRKLGKSSATTESRCRSALSNSGFSLAFNSTPMGALRARSASRSFWKRASDTMAPPLSGSGASSAIVVKVSATSASPVISGIQLFPVSGVFERLHADATIGVEEAFALVAQFQILIHHPL